MFKKKLVTFLWGITFSQFWKLLWRTPGSVEFRYLPGAILILLMSLINSFFCRCDERKNVKFTKVKQASKCPVFVLGHWGSGTTYLHKLIAADPQFNFPTLYQVTNPSTFICTQKLIISLTKAFFPSERHWDASKIDPLMPMEDELAISLLSLRSPYMGWVFPKNEEYYDKYLTFEGADKEAVDEWKQSFEWFIQKISGDDDRDLVLKSPTHTARIKTILECFPNAKFVHINRDPYELYQATVRLYEKALPYFCLQSRDYTNLRESILNRYQLMYSAYFDDISTLSEEQYCEVAFDDLIDKPLDTIENIYTKLNIVGFNKAKLPIKQFIGSVSDYQEPEEILLSEDTKMEIVKHWKDYYTKWGY